MAAAIPDGVYTMAAKMSIIQSNAAACRAGSRRFRQEMLDELTTILHLNRHYLARLLRKAGTKVHTADGRTVVADATVSRIHHRGRKRTCNPDTLRPILLWRWRLLHFPAAPLFVAFIRGNWDKLLVHQNFQQLPPDSRRHLQQISASTVERLLRPVRQQLELHDRYFRTRAISALKQTIPVETCHDKPKDQFGYLEADLVPHGGGSSQGEFACTLTVTGITTGWTEVRALRNKAQTWTKAALSDVFCVLPFRPSALHTDNGSEFINHHRAEFAERCRLRFTRSRDFPKNDSPSVESRNCPVVRVHSGYQRYDTEEELRALALLNELLSVRQNYFMPTMKLRERRRAGPRVIKRYEIDTPLNRLLARAEVRVETKRQLRQWREGTDLFWLLAEIERAKEMLARAHRQKYNHSAQTRRTDHEEIHSSMHVLR